MEPWLEELIARGRVTGSLTFDEVNAVIPSNLDADQLAALVDRLEAVGILLIDPGGDVVAGPDLPPRSATPADTGDVLGGRYHRNVEFDKLLRDHGVPFSDAACSFESEGRVFDAELIVPGERALAAWLALRNLVLVTDLWPVIQDAVAEPSFTGEPEPLDPGGRWHAWGQAWRRDRNTPMPELTPATIRADAAANIAEAAKVPTTPWAFRGRSGTPPEPTDDDTPLDPSEPNLSELFSDAGPFRATREAAGGDDWPFHPFVRVRLYPTRLPWEVFAYSPFGGWNDAPRPEEQLAMLRHWHELYGIEVVSVSGDWFELFVPRPPRSRCQALRAVAEMRWFGEETIFGYGSVTDDAAVERARASHYWYFWWD